MFRDVLLQEAQRLASAERPSQHSLSCFRATLTAFVQENEDASSTSEETDLRGVVPWLVQASDLGDPDILVLILKVMRILSRQAAARLALTASALETIVQHVASPNGLVAGEAANVVLNLCYEAANVDLVVRAGGVQRLVALLRPGTPVLAQANAAGAVQSISFQAAGRAAALAAGALPPLVVLLDSGSGRVQGRAVGALHNLSSDPAAIRVIRQLGGIPKLAGLLRSASAGVAGNAAGALQNVAREVAARQAIHALRVVPDLLALLTGPDLQAQLCAAGALLNILGPAQDEAAAVEGNAVPAAAPPPQSNTCSPDTPPRLPQQQQPRRALADALGCALTLSAARHTLFGPRGEAGSAPTTV